jgi:hypothetical protein
MLKKVSSIGELRPNSRRLESAELATAAEESSGQREIQPSEVNCSEPMHTSRQKLAVAISLRKAGRARQNDRTRNDHDQRH